MAITYKIWDFPTLNIRSQLFYAPGAAFDGGFTGGSARFLSPEPGGRAFLETELSLQTNEWETPLSSWLMSKTNGEIFRIQLVKTPQLVSNAALGIIPSGSVPWSNEGQYPENQWDNNENWSLDDVFMTASTDALNGETILIVDTSLFGPVLRHGHVIGHNDNSYVIDDIEYDENIATITVKPPLRDDVSTDDFIMLRPYFLGNIANGSEIRTGYEASNNGHIQLSRIIFGEVIL